MTDERDDPTLVRYSREDDIEWRLWLENERAGYDDRPFARRRMRELIEKARSK